MIRLYIGIVCTFLIAACTPEKEEETANPTTEAGGAQAGTPSTIGGMPASAGTMGGTWCMVPPTRSCQMNNTPLQLKTNS